MKTLYQSADIPQHKFCYKEQQSDLEVTSESLFDVGVEYKQLTSMNYRNESGEKVFTASKKGSLLEAKKGSELGTEFSKNGADRVWGKMKLEDGQILMVALTDKTGVKSNFEKITEAETQEIEAVKKEAAEKTTVLRSDLVDTEIQTNTQLGETPIVTVTSKKTAGTSGEAQATLTNDKLKKQNADTIRVAGVGSLGESISDSNASIAEASTELTNVNERFTELFGEEGVYNVLQKQVAGRVMEGGLIGLVESVVKDGFNMDTNLKKGLEDAGLDEAQMEEFNTYAKGRAELIMEDKNILQRLGSAVETFDTESNYTQTKALLTQDVVLSVLTTLLGSPDVALTWIKIPAIKNLVAMPNINKIDGIVNTGNQTTYTQQMKSAKESGRRVVGSGYNLMKNAQILKNPTLEISEDHNQLKALNARVDKLAPLLEQMGVTIKENGDLAMEKADVLRRDSYDLGFLFLLGNERLFSNSNEYEEFKDALETLESDGSTNQDKVGAMKTIKDLAKQEYEEDFAVTTEEKSSLGMGTVDVWDDVKGEDREQTVFYSMKKGAEGEITYFQDRKEITKAELPKRYQEQATNAEKTGYNIPKAERGRIAAVNMMDDLYANMNEFTDTQGKIQRQADVHTMDEGETASENLYQNAVSGFLDQYESAGDALAHYPAMKAVEAMVESYFDSAQTTEDLNTLIKYEPFKEWMKNVGEIATDNTDAYRDYLRTVNDEQATDLLQNQEANIVEPSNTKAFGADLKAIDNASELQDAFMKTKVDYGQGNVQFLSTRVLDSLAAHTGYNLDTEELIAAIGNAEFIENTRGVFTDNLSPTRTDKNNFKKQQIGEGAWLLKNVKVSAYTDVDGQKVRTEKTVNFMLKPDCSNLVLMENGIDSDDAFIDQIKEGTGAVFGHEYMRIPITLNMVKELFKKDKKTQEPEPEQKKPETPNTQKPPEPPVDPPEPPVIPNKDPNQTPVTDLTQGATEVVEQEAVEALPNIPVEGGEIITPVVNSPAQPMDVGPIVIE